MLKIAPKPMRMETDFLIIGSGIAGLSFALKAANLGKVILISKATLDEGSTRYAQGGIASVFSESDSIEHHVSDTLIAGDGLCNEKIVKITATEGPARVKELINLGVPFTKRENFDEFDLTKEGGHSKRRILHADDFTGLAIENTLIEQVRNNPNITIYENHISIDLITNKSKRKYFKLNPTEKTKVLGAYVLDKTNNLVHTISANFTVLATGGAGKVYLYTTNPDTATGDGIAMAYRAGARIANMEFMQFHPTCLYVPNKVKGKKEKTFLISEALRGEGGILRDKNGFAFMEKYHPLKNLAPRDIVARAIDSEMKRQALDCVYLDMTAHSKEMLMKRFPNIFEHCMSVGIDISKDWIPVVPAAHYTCGGIHTDENGQSTIKNLYAIGETACTGLHGANRLASNSLLEGVVFAHRAFLDIENQLKLNPDLFKNKKEYMPDPLAEWDSGQAVPMEEQINIHHTWREIRTLMWNYIGIVRSNKRLLRAQTRLDIIRHEVQEYYWHYLLTADLIELRNLVTVAELIVQCALERKESRGLHYNLDFPLHDDQFFLKDTIV